MRSYAAVFIIATLIGCGKIVDIPQPVDSITSEETFSSDATATAALLSIYSDLYFCSGKSQGFATSGMSVFGGLAADELNLYNSININFQQFQSNSLRPENDYLGTLFWAPAFRDIYLANAVIEGVQKSSAIQPTTKDILIGEAKFLRAFCYFYVTNLFGDAPLMTSTSWNSNYLLKRAPVASVYDQIIADLLSAQELLPESYPQVDNTPSPITAAERVRANKYAVTSLLARVYLFNGKFELAEQQASMVIGKNDYYSLAPYVDMVFKPNSTESILQLQTNATTFPYATMEGSVFVPYSGTGPDYILSSDLLSAFEPGDSRRSDWVDSVLDGATYYFYPGKYKVKQGASGATPTEYYTVLRLPELYLIRAESRAKQKNLSGAISDLNILRDRARAAVTPSVPNPLPALQNTLTEAQVFAAVAQERRIEFFAEWGHRWLDLKRTNQAEVVLPGIKVNWDATDKLWPIPFSEMLRNSNFEQNPGYQ